METIQYKEVQLSKIEAEALAELETHLEFELVLLDDTEQFNNKFPNRDFYEDLFYSTPFVFTVKEEHVDSLLLIDLNDCEWCTKEDEKEFSPKFEEFRIGKEIMCLNCGIKKIPQSIVNLSNLKQLHIWGNNSLQKLILPAFMSYLKKLKALFLINCFPQTFIFLKELKNLRTLYLHLYLTKIPESIFHLSSLKYLNLDDNQIKEISAGIMFLDGLKVLSVKDNYLYKVSDKIRFLLHLKELYLDNNTHLDSIPESLGLLRNLEVFSLNNTAIERIPDSFGDLHNLKILSLNNCKNIKLLPESLGKLQNLQELNVMYCSLDTLPSSLCNLENLNKLVIEGNLLLEIPEELADKIHTSKLVSEQGLVYLNLERSEAQVIKEIETLTHLKFNLENRITQRISTGWGGLDPCMDLTIKNNHIESISIYGGAIEKLPDSIGNLRSLIHLRCEGRRKLTCLPNTIGQLKSLQKLFLNHNSLKELPESILHIESLKYIDLTYNPKEIKKSKIVMDISWKGVRISLPW